MAGIPLEHAERLLVTERLQLDAVDCPVRYEVWRAFAAAGPETRLALLLERSPEDGRPAAEQIAHQLRGRIEAAPTARATEPGPATLEVSVTPPPGAPAPPPPVRSLLPSPPDEERIVSFGEWVLADIDLFELVTAVLPLTPWEPVIEGIRSDDADLVSLLVPPHAGVRRAEGVPPPNVVDPPVEDNLRGRKSWLARVLVRLWGADPDLDSERVRGAGELRARLGRSEPSRDASYWRGSAVSVNLDRRVRTAVNYSTSTVKGDAARRVFDIKCSGLTWAVIDAGIDARHPAFRQSENPFETRITKIVDFTRITKRAYRELQDTLGFVAAIDDMALVLPPRRADDPDFPPGAGSHGTHVAGILAGDWQPPGTGEERLTGMCPDLKLWDLRVVGADGQDLESRVVMALQYIREVNERAGKELRVCGVNLSLSIPYNPESFCCGWTPVCQEARRLVRSGVVVVAAAGNEGFDASIAGPSTAGRGFTTVGITDPGNAEELITVGATHRFEPHRYGASFFSSKGPTADGRVKPDLLAPGENIRSAVDREGAGSMNGTSQAAPHVSGAAALLLARYRELLGRPEEVKRILCSTATDLGRSAYFQGTGLLDVMRSLQSV